MSYNYNPDWCEVDDSVFDNLVCPYCYEKFGNLDSVTEDIRKPGYYKPRHIPDTIILNCFNPMCVECDSEFTFKLKATIIVEPLN